MFIGANAATYNWHCRHQKGFTSPSDNKHRVELDARELSLTARWNELAQDALRSHAPCQATLGEVMAFDMLYEAYPNLAKLPVELTLQPLDSTKPAASVTRRLLTRYHVTPEAPAFKPADVLAHEVQHIGQAIEGFSDGSSIAYEFERQALLWQSELKNGAIELTGGRYIPQPVSIAAKHRRRLLSFCNSIVDSPDKFARAERLAKTEHPACHAFLEQLQNIARQNYFGSAGEVEAFEAERRRLWTPEERAKSKPRHAVHLRDMQWLTGDCWGVLYEPRPENMIETIAIARHDLIPAKPVAQSPHVQRPNLLLRLLFGVR